MFLYIPTHRTFMAVQNVLHYFFIISDRNFMIRNQYRYLYYKGSHSIRSGANSSLNYQETLIYSVRIFIQSVTRKGKKNLLADREQVIIRKLKVYYDNNVFSHRIYLTYIVRWHKDMRIYQDLLSMEVNLLSIDVNNDMR